MSDLKDQFDKVGGTKLLKQYAKSGVLFTALESVIVNGTSKTGLELLRLSVQLKIRKRLYKEFGSIVKEIDQNNKFEKKSSSKVWICWFQGIENAPLLVRRCFESIKRNMSDRDIVVLTNDNISDYVEIPEHIKMALDSGKMTLTFFSDILRLELLIKYGGLWIDATVLCTDNNIPKYITDSDLFMYQVLKPGRDGHSITMSSWLISARSNNPVLVATRDMIYEYWKKYDYLMDYGLLHIFMSIALDELSEEKNKIPKFPNSIPHILLLDMFDAYDEERYNYIKSLTPFHKLTDKRPIDLLKKENTFYDILINKGLY